MLNVRRCLAALAVVFAACASSSSGISVSVTELRGRGQRPPTVGEHFYRIRVTNHSTEPIAVESINIQPAGMTELDVEDASQSFDETIGADESRTFDMTMDVLSSRAIEHATLYTPSFNSSIDSLRVMIVGRNEKGRFTDSGDYPIGYEPVER